jgi:hypothetical protein
VPGVLTRCPQARTLGILHRFSPMCIQIEPSLAAITIWRFSTQCCTSLDALRTAVSCMANMGSSLRLARWLGA